MRTVHLPAERLIHFLDGWKARRILVAGDFMLDRYTYGNAERLSPDAPVPVLAEERQEAHPGGAANVCLDLRALRCEVACVGVVGDDPDGVSVRESLHAAGCATGGIALCPTRPTTVKHSFIGLAQHRHPQKMFRVDREERSCVPPEVEQKLLAAAMTELPGADAVCIEDYGKGAITPTLAQKLIAAARRLGKLVLVDPAPTRDYSKYRGATAVTPNRTEAALATGMEPGADWSQLSEMARRLVDQLELAAAVLTLDKQGALLLENGCEPQHLPARARAVYDVTGAGDMVLAMLAAALSNGADFTTAVALTNVAAGLEVERFGVVPIELGEILLALLRQNHEQLGKLRTLQQLLVEVQAYRDQGKKIVFTNGCFDVLHAGHVQLLRQARQAGDLLIVAINSDDSIRRLKPGRPINRQLDRVAVLGELQSVDYITVFDEDRPDELIRALKPDVLVKGGDYTREQVVGHEIVDSYGGQVMLVPPVEGLSTTNLILRMNSNARP